MKYERHLAAARNPILETGLCIDDRKAQAPGVQAQMHGIYIFYLRQLKLQNADNSCKISMAL